MSEVSSTARRLGGERVPEEAGGWERPDAAGVVRRGGAAEVVAGYRERFGEAPRCWAGKRPGEPGGCERAAVMEVYGLAMCEAHGEEAAAAALEEIAHDLENELERPLNPHVRRLSPHVRHALSLGFGASPAEAHDYERADAALMAAFPLDRSRVRADTLAYVEEPDDHQPPSDAALEDRRLVCRLMRLALEDRATWMVEVLEPHREKVAEQAAYALALEREAGLG